MSRTKKAKDRIRGGNGTNIHHCINKSSGGRDVTNNMISLDIKVHNALHTLFGNKLPHEILEMVINVICKPITNKVKKELLDVLKKNEGKEYQTNTYHGSRPTHGPFDGGLHK